MEAPREPDVVAWLVPVALWVALVQLKSYLTQGFGGVSFVLITAMVALLWRAPALVRGPPRPARWVLPLVVVLLVAVASPALWSWAQLVRAPAGRYGFDITDNTVAAVNLFVEGKNPYTGRAQLWHTVGAGPHVEVDGDALRLFGARYVSGYPYFPLMFLSYVPVRALSADANFMRIGALGFLALCVLSLFQLTRALAPRQGGRLAAALAVLAFLAPTLLLTDVLNSALPDIAMAAYLTAACWALTRGAWLSAGALSGLAQACKLLPAPVFVVAVAWWLWRRPGFGRFVGAYALTTSVIVLPFVWRAPEEFFSSTVLFYLTFHAAGDGTSLWIVLPTWLQPVLSLLGVGVAGGALWRARRARDVSWPLLMACTAYLALVATAKMIHMNYLWVVCPVSCAVLLARVARGEDA